MGSQHGEASGGLLTGGEIDETENAVVSMAMNNGELAEILVERDEYSLLGVCAAQDRVVARILGPTACPNNIVSCGTKLVGSFAPHARIEKKFHTAAPAVIVRGSMRSLAT